jgi:hypothetical protein
LYLGRNNSENSNDHTISQLYGLLPTGIYKQLTYQVGLPLLVLAVVLNAQLVRRVLPPSADQQRTLQLLRWTTAFITLYLLLLPLGGYRSYRPFLLRNDSLLPITLALVLAYGTSTYLLLAALPKVPWRIYLAATLAVSLFFVAADHELETATNNGFERWGMEQLAYSKESVVRIAYISEENTVLSWIPISDYNQSEYSAEMLLYWHITPDKKLYYQQPGQ